MQPTPTRRPRTAALAVLGTGLLVAGVLSGGEAAFAATDSTFSALSSDFAAGSDSIVLGADIVNTAGTLTLGPDTGGTAGYSTLYLNGHTLTVKGIQLTSNQAGTMTGSTLRILGSGTLNVAQTSTALPAIEVDSASALTISGGTVNASVPTGSTAAVIGGGPVFTAIQNSGPITVNGSATVTASGSSTGAAIGAGQGASASGGLTFAGSSSTTATSAGGGAAIGDGSGTAGASILVANDAIVVAHQAGTGSTGAGIGGGASPTGQTSGTVAVGDNATVTATSAGAGAAIGGGYHGDGGSISVTGYATVVATADASTGEAGIGDGDTATGSGSNVVIQNATHVTATGGGAGGAGIGGGSGAYGNGSVSISGTAQVVATGVDGPGIGGEKSRNSLSVSISGAATVTAVGGGNAAAIGGGDSFSGAFPSVGAAVSIGSGTQVSVSAPSASVIGGGASSNFGSLANSGTLTIPSGSTLAVPGGASASNDGTVVNAGTISVASGATFANGGLIANSGTIAGAGLVSNSGTIRQNGTVSAGVTGNDFTLTYDAQGGSVGTATQHVYADTTNAAQISIPTATPPSAGVFTGWNSSADGTGSGLSATGSLTTLAGASSSDGTAVTVRVYALYQLNPVLPSGSTLAQAVVGTGYSSTIAATSGTSPITYGYTGSFPAGLSFSTSTGVISGTPTTAGTFTMHVTASNAAGSTTHDYTIQVVPTVLTVGISPTSKGNARYLAGGSASVALGGLQANEAYTLTVGGTKVYSGTAPTSSAFTVRITVPKSITDGSQSVVLTGGGHAVTGSATILTASVSKHLAVKASLKTVKAKKKFSLTVSRLYAKESVRVVIKAKHKHTTAATGSATSTGKYVLTLRKGLAKGKWTVTVTGAGTSRTVTMHLTVH